jgi:hypothetical protein
MVMVFCDALRVCSEIHRAPGRVDAWGQWPTLLAPPPDEPAHLLATMEIHLRQKHEWQQVYATAGFADDRIVRRIASASRCQVISKWMVFRLHRRAMRGLTDPVSGACSLIERCCARRASSALRWLRAIARKGQTRPALNEP